MKVWTHFKKNLEKKSNRPNLKRNLQKKGLESGRDQVLKYIQVSQDLNASDFSNGWSQ